MAQFQLAFRLEIAHERKQVGVIMDNVKKMLRCCEPLRVDEIRDFSAAVSEALANALDHGEGAIIAEGFIACPNDGGVGINVNVYDHGKGFDLSKPPTLPDNPMAERGRGRYFMASYCDEVVWERVEDKDLFACRLYKHFILED